MLNGKRRDRPNLANDADIDRSLQELGDLRRLMAPIEGGFAPNLIPYDISFDFDFSGWVRIVCGEIRSRARQYEARKDYRNAEYLYRHSCADNFNSLEPPTGFNSDINKEFAMNTASVYEKLGNFHAAELIQERLVSDNQQNIKDPYKIPQEINELVRLWAHFIGRCKSMNLHLEPFAKAFILWHAAAIDVDPLTDSLLEQRLIELETTLSKKFLWSGNLPLHLAVHKNATGFARILIKNGARVEGMDRDGDTPLIRAVRNRHLRMACLLLDNGADPLCSKLSHG